MSKERRQGVARTRATNLRAGIAQASSVPDLQFTQKIGQALSAITEGFEEGARQRAWEIVGPYGSGKSTFGLFLLRAFGSEENSWTERALSSLSLLNDELAERVVRIRANSPGGYVTVAIEGGRMPLDLALAKGLLDAARRAENAPGWASEGFIGSLERTLVALEAGLNDAHGVAELYQRAAELARIAGRQGVLVVIDEFGKFLERAAWRGDTPDIVVAQYLAEAASASPQPDLLLAVLVHQGFQHYATGLDEHQWVEWTKVQGRFTQVDFSEDPDNLYELIANINDVRARPAEWGMKMWAAVAGTGPFTKEPTYWQSLFTRTAPLHPYALYTLPRLTALLGQHERTLTTFLTTGNPLGLQSFIDSEPATTETYGIDQLLDYFLDDVRFTSLPPDVQRRVTELNAALHRLEHGSAGARIAKAVAAMMLLGPRSMLRPTRECLIAAFSEAGATESREAADTIDNLVRRQVLVHREFSGEYQLWQGSDFDIDAAVEQLRESSQTNISAKSLDALLQPRPVVARKHSIETGATRWFRRAYVPVADLPSAVDLLEPLKPGAPKPDGLIVLAIPSNRRDLDSARAWAQGQSDPRIITAVPNEPTQLLKLAQDLSALEAIAINHESLRGDPVAAGEVAARASGIRMLLSDSATELFEPGTSSCNWYWLGDQAQVRARAGLNRLVSAGCDRVYPATPRIPNELVNRTSLSTSWVVAVRKIIQELLNDNGDPLLRFEGRGPEVGILRAALVDTGLYRQKSGAKRYGLARPTRSSDQGIRETWNSIERFIKSSGGAPRSLSELVGQLSAPPFGVKPGLMPLLIWAVLIHHREDLCLFDDGTYLRDWAIEDFDHFVKSPQSFTVRWLVLEGKYGSLIRALNDSIPNSEDIVKGAATPVPGFLANMFRWYHALPQYSKHTGSMSKTSQDFLRSLVNAMDPAALVLEEIPAALGLPSAPNGIDDAFANRYLAGFRSTIQEAHQAYPVLCNEIVDRLCDGLRIRGGLHALRLAIEGQLASLGGHVRDPAAKAFLIRGADRSLNDIQWVESVASALAGQSPRFWYDHHLEEFTDKLSTTALVLRDAERTAFARSAATAGGSASEHVRVSVEQAGRDPHEYFVAGNASDEDEGAARAVVAFLNIQAPGITGEQRRQILALALGIAVNETVEGED